MSTTSPIVPTVGRVVLVRSSDMSVTGAFPGIEVPAHITAVESNDVINVMVMRDGFENTPRGDVSIQYDDDMSTMVVPTSWRWMPYQLAVAAERDPVSGEAIGTVVAAK